STTPSSITTTGKPEGECELDENPFATRCDGRKREICAVKCSLLTCICPLGFSRITPVDPCEEVLAHSANFTLTGKFDSEKFDSRDPDCAEPHSDIKNMTLFMKAVTQEAVKMIEEEPKFVNMDIREMRVEHSPGRASGDKLIIIGIMQFPSDGYNENATTKLKNLLQDSGALQDIFSSLSDLIPDSLDSDSPIDFEMNLEPEEYLCENNTCPSYSLCINESKGKPPTCKCQEGLEDLNTDFPGRACATPCTDDYCSNRGSCEHDISTLLSRCKYVSFWSPLSSVQY
ncbi:unnamed protein product, partial [Darwinula stevensoni]